MTPEKLKKDLLEHLGKIDMAKLSLSELLVFTEILAKATAISEPFDFVKYFATMPEAGFNSAIRPVSLKED